LPDDTIAFVVRDPYLPPGTLREALCYPRKADGYVDEEIVGALQRAGLGKLVSGLDEQFRMDQAFDDEQRRLVSLAQLLLHRPKWIVIDNIGDFADEQVFEIATSIFQNDLSDSAIIAFGPAGRLQAIFMRTLALELFNSAQANA
jgi:putative ATP-binding cassette transporter